MRNIIHPTRFYPTLSYAIIFHFVYIYVYIYSELIRTQCVTVGRMPHGGRRSKSVVPEPDTVGIGFHDADGLVAVESGSVAGRRQHRTG